MPCLQLVGRGAGRAVPAVIAARSSLSHAPHQQLGVGSGSEVSSRSPLTVVRLPLARSPVCSLGAWMMVSARFKKCSIEQLLTRQTTLQALYESRIASLQRLIAFFVMFHAMGKAVQDFWPAVSFGIFGYDMSHSQSIMRIATTASPVSGMAVRLRVVELQRQMERSWGQMRMAGAFRIKQAFKASEETLMTMVMKGHLTQAQMGQVMAMKEEANGKKVAKRRAAIMGDASAGMDSNLSLEEMKEAAKKKTDVQYSRVHDALKGSDVFKGVDPQRLADAVALTVDKVCASGEVVITQGEEGEHLYIVETGEYTVHLQQAGPQPVSTITAGAVFGDIAILYNCPRAATIKCSSAGTLWSLERRMFQLIMRSTKNAVSLASKVLNEIPLLSGLTDDQREALASELEEMEVDGGEQIATQGQVADTFFIIQKGVVVMQRDDGAGVEELRAPSYFGDYALDSFKGLDAGDSSLTSWPRSFRADPAVGQTSLLSISRERFIELIGPLREVLWSNEVGKLFDGVPLFGDLNHDQRSALMGKMRQETYHEGQNIFSQGDEGTSMYIIRTGTVKVTRDVDGEIVVLAPEVGKGSFFGETAILTDMPRSATITATSPVLDLLSLSRENVRLMMGSLEVLAAQVQARRDREAMRARSSAFASSDLIEVGKLGSGTFGKVALVEHKPTGKTFALKSMVKKRLVAQKQVDHALQEKIVLAMCSSPFINSLVAVLCDASDPNGKVHMLLEPCLGGELFALLHEAGCFEFHTANFYAACVTSALAHLHSNRTVYRDLKPENVVIDHHGYLQLIDFGFAKILSGSPKTYTLCGTPEYLAPELVTSQGHGLAADWWSAGVLVYEMLTGTTPFASNNTMAVYNKIIAARFQMPSSMRSVARELISRMLVPNPSKRLGGSLRGAREVTEHVFFKPFDWHKLEMREYPPPWMPALADDRDTTYFESVDDEDKDKDDGEKSEAASEESEEIDVSKLVMPPGADADIERLNEGFSKL